MKTNYDEAQELISDERGQEAMLRASALASLAVADELQSLNEKLYEILDAGFANIARTIDNQST